MKIGFGDVDINSKISSGKGGGDEYTHSYDGTWLGRSCGARWKTEGSVEDNLGILVTPGEHGVDFSNEFYENKILHTKNGVITINSIKQNA